MPEGLLVYRHTIDATTYTFPDLRALLAKATPPRSGDRLAGIAADSAEQMIAARMALADVPLAKFLQEAVIPYEADEVTRLVIDTHDVKAFAPVASLRIPRLAVVGRCDDRGGAKTVPRGGRGLKTDA
jgi:ethanolamine ammonia-lyase large subunit